MGVGSSRNKGNSDWFYNNERSGDFTVSSVQARADGKGPPEIIACFLDLSQGPESGLLAVTPQAVENFSPEAGFRKWKRKWDNKSGTFDTIVAADLILTPDSRQLVVGFRTGSIEIIDGMKLTAKANMQYILLPAEPLQLPADQVQLPAMQECLTAISMPIDNVIVCGYTSGNVLSFYADSGKAARKYLWPSVATCSKVESIEPVVGTMNSRHVQHFPSPVAALGFFSPKQWLIVGYASRKVLLNASPDGGQTILRNLTPPVSLFSLDKERLLATFEPVDDTVIFTTIFQLGHDSSNRTRPSYYVISVMPSSLSVWEIPINDVPNKVQPHIQLMKPVLTIDFAANLTPPVLISLGQCASACFDSDVSVVFLLFNEGFVAAVAFHHSKTEQVHEGPALEAVPQAGESSSSSTMSHRSTLQVSEKQTQEASTDDVKSSSRSSLAFTFYRLLKVQTEHIDDDDDKAGRAEQGRLKRQLTSLGYDRISQSLIVGDSRGKITVAPDTFGKYQASQMLREAEQTEALKRSEQQSSVFVPTLYVGKQKDQQSWLSSA